ncbi:unnamed protein product [Rotaria magnacalcarata]
MTRQFTKKPTNTDLYLLYESNQCRKYKLGLISSIIIRIRLICSSDEFANIELKQLKSTLHDNGYPDYLIRRGIREGEVIAKKMINKQQNKNIDNIASTIIKKENIPNHTILWT